MKCKKCGREYSDQEAKSGFDSCEYCDKWGSPQHWGKLKIRYKPTGEIKELKLGIRRMSYNNELVFCDAWGYDKGNPTELNNPDNYEVIEVKEQP